MTPDPRATSGRGLRDRRFRDAVSVYLVDAPGGTDAVVTAFHDLVSRNARGVAALAWPSARRAPVAARADLATASVHRVAGSDDLAVVRALTRRPPGPLAVALGVLDDAVAIAVEHAAADGSEAVALLSELLETAAGGAPPPLVPGARLPLLRAALAAGPVAFRRYLLHRRRFLPPPPLLLGERVAGVDDSFLRVEFPVGALRALQTGERASSGAVLVAAMAAGLQAGFRGDGDPRLVIPVDLRRLTGGRVPGNFIATETAGALLADNWDAASAAAVLERQVAIGLPQLLVGTFRFLRPGRARREDGGPELYVSLSVQRVPTGSWGNGRPRMGIAGIGRQWPSATLAAAFIHEETVSVSVHDDSGRFDLAAVEAALQARMTPGGSAFGAAQ